MTNIDTFSFQLGMINCFAEMVACGVKQLAISPPLTPKEFERIETASDEIVRQFGISSHLEKSLIITDLQSEALTEGKWSILYFRDELTLDAYYSLKRSKAQLEEVGQYDERAREQVSRDFMRLLSYSDDVIDVKLSLKTPTDPYIFDNTPEES